ncbi:MAG: twin-arginine translocation signal domain-containing protein [Deltaproteobacteria bacterium]|nr:twin-arginine translocation signal domain-containing protein [Deltaproteobacteria bacterium]
MKVTRREFLKYCTASAVALGLTSALGPLARALAAGNGPPIIWLSASSCTGCTVSLANRVSSSAPVDLTDLLINTINLAYHPNLMGAAGDLAVQTLRTVDDGSFILAVEGGIPTIYNGKTCILWSENGVDVTAMAAVNELAAKAAKILSIGTCAAYGGIPGGAPNPTAVKSVKALTGRSNIINIPGCPPHPDWIVWTIAQLLAGRNPSLDSSGRPTELFGATVHSKCPRRDTEWATSLSQTGRCLNNLGCKGQQTYADCASRKWNNGVNWCVGSDSLCQGCTQSTFPDKFAPLFSTMGANPLNDHPKVTAPRNTCNSCHQKKP